MIISQMNYTTDTFFNGRISLAQKKDGYRYSVDSIILANHVKPEPEDRILDLGTGCGIMPVILNYLNPEISIHGIEIQQDLADLAILNVKQNSMDNKIRIVNDDLTKTNVKNLNPPYDIIISNPPYWKTCSGRINPNREKAIAKHEIKITLKDIIHTAAKLLIEAGRFIVVYSTDRMADIIIHMRSGNIEAKYIRIIYPNINTAAKLFLIEGIKNGNPGLTTAPPLIIYNEDGSYTDEMNHIFSGKT